MESVWTAGTPGSPCYGCRRERLSYGCCLCGWAICSNHSADAGVNGEAARPSYPNRLRHSRDILDDLPALHNQRDATLEYADVFQRIAVNQDDVR